MVRWGALAGIVLAVTAALAVAVLLQGPGESGPGVVVLDVPKDGMLAVTLSGSGPACSLCHYAWDAPFEAVANRSGDHYRVQIRPTADYELYGFRAVPVYGGKETPNLFELQHEGRVLLGQTTEQGVHVNPGAGGLTVVLQPVDEDLRPALDLEVESPEGEKWRASGATAMLNALPDETAQLPPGDYIVRVTYRAGSIPAVEYRLTYDTSDARATHAPRATLSTPTVLTWDLEAPPRGFVVEFRAFNAHPTDRWRLPASGDVTGKYSLFVENRVLLDNATRVDAPVFDTAMRPESGRVLLYEEDVDFTTVRSRNAQGEWTQRSVYRKFPPPEQPFPPIPAGATRIEAVLTWQPRNPLAPPAEWFFTWSHAVEGPSFHYPRPVEEGDGLRRYVLDVPPTWWEAPGSVGAFQGFPRLALGPQSAVAFDGAMQFTLEAIFE